MDDREYYSIMNRSSSFVIGQFLEKRKGRTQKKSASFSKLERQQGREDAQMLMERELEAGGRKRQS